MHPVPTVVYAFLGSATGITLSYALGRFGGVYLIDKYGHIIHFTVERRATVTAMVGERWGRWGLIVCYFIPGIRHVGAQLAGTSGLHYPAFATFAYAGALIWSLTFILAGYFLEHEWEHIADVVRPHLVIIGITAGVVLLAVFAVWLVTAQPRQALNDSRSAS